MQKSIWKKAVVVGTILLFFGASTTIGMNTSSDISQLPRVMQHRTHAIPQDVVNQPCLVGNVKVSPNAGNDSHPRMTTNATGNIIIVYEQEEDKNTKTVPVVYSADGGDIWTQQFLFNSLKFPSGSGVLGYPDIIYNPTRDLLWCVAFDPLAEMYNEEMYYIPGNIATATEAIGYAISGSTMNYWYGACAHTNDYFLVFNTQGYGDMPRILGLTWMVYPDFSYPPGLGGFYYDGESILRISPLAELEADYNVNRWFLVAESEAIQGGTQIVIKSGTTDKDLITSGEQKDGMDKYGDPEQAPGEFLGLGTDPDVSGSGSNVAVVFVRNDSILCSVSSCVATYEPEFHWHTTTVDTGGASTPAVYMQGSNVYVAYVKNGNLYYKVSEDGGLTWGAAIQKNSADGTVVAQKGAVDICKNGIAFTDTRNGNYDIYFSSYEASPTPELAITSISPFTIKNIGNAPAFNVSWSITINGGFILIGKSSSGVILGPLDPGQEIIVRSSKFLLGFGKIEITFAAWADNAPMVTIKIAGRLLLYFFIPQ
jgi:hypothetical protein